MNLSRYISNISSLQFFQLFRFGILFLISIVFTKSHLSTTQIGIYETLMFVAGAVSFFWLSGLIQSFLPLYKKPENSTNKTSDIFNASLLIAFFSFIAFIFVNGFKFYIFKYINNSAEIPYFNLFSWYILLIGPTSFIEYIYLLNNEARWIIKYGVISFVLQFLFIVSPIILGFGLEYSIVGLILISAIRIIWLIFLIKKYSVFSFSFPYIRQHLSIGLPLILGAILSGSAQYIDDFLVSHYFNNSTFAVFKYGSRQFPLIVLLANSFSNAMVPVFATHENIQSAMTTLKEKSRKMMHFLFPVSILFLLSSTWLYPVIFNHNFIESAKVFNLLLLLIMSYMVFPQTILIGMKKTRFMLTASFLEVIVHIGFSLVLIRYFGIMGIVAATIIAFFFERILLVIFNYSFFKINPSSYIPIKVYLSYCILIVAAYVGVTVFL